MADTFTTINGFLQPQVGGDNNVWGGFLNNDLQLIDNAFDGYITVDCSAGGTIVLTFTDGAADQFKNSVINLIGTPAAPFIVQLRETYWKRVILNSTAHSATINNGGGGSTVSLPAGILVGVYSDAVNVFEAVQQVSTLYSSNATITAGALSNITFGTGNIFTSDYNSTAGNINLTNGSVNLTNGNVILTNGNETITAGNLAVTAGSVTVGGNYSSTNGSILLTNGSETLTNGNLTLSNGNLVVTAGSGTFGGNLAVTGSMTVGGSFSFSGNLGVTGNLNVSGTTTLAATTASSVAQVINAVDYNYSPFAFRNRLVNPFMNIDQRKAGALITLVSGTSVFSGDQWQTVYTDSNITAPHVQALVANAPAFLPNGKSLQFTNSGGHAVQASTVARFTQNIEGYNVTDFSWGTASAKPVVLSFWINSSVGSFTGSASLQNFGNTRSYIQNFTVASANTWTQIILVFPGDTGGSWTNFDTNLAALSVNICFAAGTSTQGVANAWTTQTGFYGTSSTSDFLANASATLYITAVQLELGNVATQIERRPFQQYLGDCQRYYEKSYDFGSAPGDVSENGASFAFLSGAAFTSQLFQSGNSVTFKQTKRAVPTVTLYNPATGTAGQVRDELTPANLTGAQTNVGFNGFAWNAITTTGHTLFELSVHWGAEAGL